MTAGAWLDAVVDTDDDGAELEEAIGRVLAGDGPQRIGGHTAPPMELSLTPPVYCAMIDPASFDSEHIDILRAVYRGHTIDLRAEPPQEPNR